MRVVLCQLEFTHFRVCLVPSASTQSLDTGQCNTAGFGAAKHLSSQGYSVTLLDASPNPGGLSAGWRTEQGRAVEAGVKGFWYQVISKLKTLSLSAHVHTGLNTGAFALIRYTAIDKLHIVNLAKAHTASITFL